MKYKVDRLPQNSDDDDEEDTWDASDWCYTITDEKDEIVCICATKKEAEHIAAVLTDEPIPE